MLHTFWLVQGIAAKNWYTTESFNDTHNSVLSDWQTVDKLLTYCGEVNLVKCKDGYFTKSVVTKAMTVAKPYYTATKIEVKPVKEVRTMTSFIKSDVSINHLGQYTANDLADYSVSQLKGIIAKALMNDYNAVLSVKEVKQIFKDNNLEVSTDKATTKLFWQQMTYSLTSYWFWNKPIVQLDAYGNEVEGVTESLGSQCGGSLQPNSLITDSNHYLVGTMYRGALSQKFTNIKEAYQDFTSYTVDELVDEDSVILIEVVNGEEVVIDSKSKEELLTSSNDSETSVNLSEIQLTEQSDYQVLPLQTNFSHYSYFTLDTQLTYMRFGNEFHPVEVDLDSKPKTVKDLITQETHLWDDMFFTAFYGSPYNLEQENIVATVTSDNKFKGIPVEHNDTQDKSSVTLEQLNLLAHELRMYCDYAYNRPTLSPSLCKNGKYYHNHQESILVFEMDSLNIWSFANECTTAEFLRDSAKVIGTGVKQQQVPSTHKRLTAKLELFALMTEFVFLMQCYLEFIGYFSSTNYDVNLTEIGSELYQAWRLTTNIFSNRYVLMPTINADTYTKLLLIHLEATTGYSNLESKSIYA